MNKEEIYDLLNRLDLQEWCTELYKVPLTWCELYDIRDYIINLEQQIKEQKEVIDEAINLIVKETKSMPTNGCKIRLIEILKILNEVSE